MTNVFKDETSLGNELVRFHRSHMGQPTEKFLRFILPKHLLEQIAKIKKVEPEKKPKTRAKIK